MLLLQALHEVVALFVELLQLLFPVLVQFFGLLELVLFDFLAFLCVVFVDGEHFLFVECDLHFFYSFADGFCLAVLEVRVCFFALQVELLELFDEFVFGEVRVFLHVSQGWSASVTEVRSHMISEWDWWWAGFNLGVNYC